MTSRDSLQRNSHLGYRVFLLRLWQDAPKQPWHVLLQNDLGERRLFSDTESLVDFLRTQMDDADRANDHPDRDGDV
ncbi:MAG: hypothetical protein ACOYYS_06890 [Chloroflexota bacterium]